MLALILAGCNDQNFSNAQSHDEQFPPEIVVDPVEIDFGSLSAGEVRQGTFTIYNEGEAESLLEVADIGFAGEGGGFTILSEDIAPTVPGGGSVEIEVAYTPEGATETATVVVDSNDEDEAKTNVTLRGEGLVPELMVSPDPVQFGDTYVGCLRSKDVTLTNIGTDLLVVTDIAGSGAGYTVTNNNALPLRMEPGATATVSVAFLPDSEADFAGSIVTQSNEPIASRTTDVTGAGAYGSEHTDTWEVPEDPPADIIFYVDQSGSMDDDQSSLASNFSAFISQLNTYTSDWHIIVANDDDGCNNSGVLTSTASDYVDRFTSAVSRGGGMWTEAGLYVTANAVDASDPGECNEKFIRDDALLHIIAVTDEPDQSPSSWSSQLDRIIAHKGSSSLVKFSAIAGDYPSGCSSRNNSADYGSGYYEAANATGGLFLSICSTWSTNVKALADASVKVDTFALTKTPDPATLVVKVNGKKEGSGWSYDSGSNAVVFDAGNEPTTGQDVSATYNSVVTCN